MTSIALVVGPTAAQAWGAPAAPRVAIVGDDVALVLDLIDAPAQVAALEQAGPRWVWWASEQAARPFVEAGLTLGRAWDLAEAHRLLVGGWSAEPGEVWAAANGLGRSGMPAPHRGDLLDLLDESDGGGSGDTDGAPGAAGGSADDDPVRPDGYLRADAASLSWAVTDERLLAWARTALTCMQAQQRLAEERSPRLVATIHAESAAAVLCEELRRDGLPVGRSTLLDIVTPLCGPAAERDAQVLGLVPGREGTDLRNPAQVRELLLSVGIDVPNTRKHVLEGYAAVHPVVPALLRWRADERIATTYGLRWIEEHIGPDDRLRGEWRSCDGGAGRMTAASGLHNLPALLRPAVAAHPGYALVRADLGQIEPRVLAVVSGDRAFAQAAQADDLYAPVAARLGVERAVAKVALLSAMYGGTAGQAAAALKGLEREYPVAIRVLEAAYAAGVRGEAVRTFGGRLIPAARFARKVAPGADPAIDAARGRFTRNAIIQGAAAEFFKAWAATVRATTRDLGAQIVLCLHDELLVHVPRDNAQEAAARIDAALQDSARRWTGGAPVRFVTDTMVIERWSDAKD